jgi:hypothetical protein
MGWLLDRFRRSSPPTPSDPDAGFERSVQDVRSAEALYYDVAMQRPQSQLRDIEAIESRASTLFTIGSTILPITAGLLTAGEHVLDDSIVGKVFVYLGFVCYLLLAGFFVWSYRINQWDARPDLPQWRDATVGRTEVEMQRWLGNACVDAYVSNEPILERKAGRIGLALWCLAGEAVCLTVAVLAPLWPPW